MGGRGSSSRTGAGGGGGSFTATPSAGGGVTITPAAQAANASRQVSDTNTHTTYFTPADKATVSNDVTDGYAIAARSGRSVPVGYYQTGYYSNVNTELRELGEGTRKALNPKTQKVVDAMDRNMRPLNNPIEATRWTSINAVGRNIGMPGATPNDIVRALSNQDVIQVKHDYTSSSWNANANTVAGVAGRDAKIVMHYSKGALAQFSPTRKEGEMVGARGVPQRYSNARIERIPIVNAVKGNRYADVLVVDCYVD